MKSIKYLLVIVLLVLFNMPSVYAECTNEEITNIKKETEKIEITYKHLGEVTKEDGSKVYNEFLVTAKNIPENIYVHLSPMTEDNFYEENGELKIKLTTGKWTYNLYSSTCETYVDEINIKFPTFNLYSLDPLCEGIDGEKFSLCGKYYESEVSREIFERRVEEYRRLHPVTKDNNSNKAKKTNILSKIIDFITDYINYIVVGIGVVIVITIITIIISKQRKRKILQ